MVEPKMAIACWNNIEIDVALQMIERKGINWSTGNKATDKTCIECYEKCRLYISPPDSFCNQAYLMYNEDPEDIEYDDEDFEWQYIEASEIFKNQIISERRNHGTAT